MKYIFLILLMFGFTDQSTAQTKEQIVKSYIDKNKTEGMMRLNHGPLIVNLGNFKNTILFFIESWNEKAEENNNYGVLYDQDTEMYKIFGYNNDDFSYSDGVISVFFENVDNSFEKELIVITEIGFRSFYVNGGYAGIKMNYQTSVFTSNKNGSDYKIIEYPLIGELLTVNQPMPMGTILEEELIGRETGANLNNILGVTYSANQVKTRIEFLKKQGLLGVIK